MNWNDVRTNWTAMDRPLMTRWEGLSETRLADIDGDRALLEEEIAKVEGLSLAEAQRQLAEWVAGPMPADVYADPSHDDAALRDSARHVPPGEDPMSDDQAFGDDNIPDRPIGRGD